tara:strand:+ start:962 stop:1783 length:822 start_codon:yes stop_codon:yes gene_type:complete
MAKKSKPKEEAVPLLYPEEGIREDGEPNPPVDDSHISAVSQETIGPVEESIPESDNTVGNADPQTIPVTISGVQYEMFPEAAAAYHNDIKERDRAYRDVVGAQTQPTEEVNKQETQEVDYNELLFTDPNEALRIHGENVAQKVYQQVEATYNQDQLTRDFWADFYADNPDLKEEDGLVKMVMSKHWSTLHSMKAQEAKNKLAEYTQSEILRLMNKNKSAGKGETNLSTSLEGDTPSSGASVSTIPAQQGSQIPPTLGEAIKQRRLMRHRKIAS